MSKYSFQNTIGELLDTPETRALIDELCPELLEHPMIEIGRAFQVETALPFIEGLVTEERIENFKVRLEQLG